MMRRWIMVLGCLLMLVTAVSADGREVKEAEQAAKATVQLGTYWHSTALYEDGEWIEQRRYQVIYHSGEWMEGIPADVRDEYEDVDLSKKYVLRFISKDRQGKWTRVRYPKNAAREMRKLSDWEEAETEEVTAGGVTATCLVHDYEDGAKAYQAFLNGVSFWMKAVDADGNVNSKLVELLSDGNAVDQIIEKEEESQKEN